ncbi:DNA repair protein RecO [bacterium]|nr:DNA repair protein RecO [bacterium]
MMSSGPEKDAALVIRTIRHGESSRIATLFTRNHGKVAVIAKGARRAKSGSTGVIEIPNLVEAVIYFKASRSVQTLGQASIIRSFPAIKRDLVLTGYASAVLELMNLSFTDAEPNPEILDTAIETLDSLETCSGSPRVNLWMFQLALFRAIGFNLDPYGCPVCGREKAMVGTRNMFWLDSGAICCSNCRPSNGACIPVSGESVSLLRNFVNGSDRILQRMKPSQSARREITDLLERFLKTHHSGIRKMPAMKMLESFENLPETPK